MRKDTFKFAMMDGMLWLAVAVGAFQNVTMIKHGFTGTEIGIVNAMYSIVSIIATPAFGILCDKIRSIKKIVLMQYAVGALFYVFYAMSMDVTILGINGLFILAPLMSIFRMPFFTLTDSWLVQASHNKHLDYGVIRSTGSLFYAVMGIAMTYIAPLVGVENVFWMSALMYIPVILIGFTIEDSYVHIEKQKEKMNFKGLFKDYFYILFLVFVFFLNILTTIESNYLPSIMDAIKIDPTYSSMVYGIRAVLEIPVLIYFNKNRNRISPLFTSVLIAMLYAVGTLLTATVAGNIIHVLLFGCLSGMGSGISIAFCSHYVYDLAPENLKATAISFYSAATSIAGILGNIGGGILVDTIGVANVLIYSSVAMIIVSALYIVLHKAKKSEKVKS